MLVLANGHVWSDWTDYFSVAAIICTCDPSPISRCVGIAPKIYFYQLLNTVVRTFASLQEVSWVQYQGKGWPVWSSHDLLVLVWDLFGYCGFHSTVQKHANSVILIGFFKIGRCVNGCLSLWYVGGVFPNVSQWCLDLPLILLSVPAPAGTLNRISGRKWMTEFNRNWNGCCLAKQWLCRVTKYVCYNWQEASFLNIVKYFKCFGVVDCQTSRLFWHTHIPLK